MNHDNEQAPGMRMTGADTAIEVPGELDPSAGTKHPDAHNAIDAAGWLRDVRHRYSPNQNHRPVGTRIDLLVIHNISLPPGDFSGDWIDDLFLDRLNPQAHPYFQRLAGLRVSAHLLIRRSGEVVQYVAFEQRAWHAGVSRFAGRDQCNDFSIGIELEGTDHIPFTEAQYAHLADCSRAILKHYPHICEQRIVGHDEIAPGRKTDPGPAFDWTRYRKAIRNSIRARSDS